MIKLLPAWITLLNSVAVGPFEWYVSSGGELAKIFNALIDTGNQDHA